MAWENGLGVSHVGNFEAAVDLTASQYCIVQLDATMKIALPSAQGIRGFGILQNAPNVGETAAVMVFGVSRVKAKNNTNGTLLAVGRNVTANGTDGHAEVAASGDFVIGIALEALTGDGEIFTAFINPSFIPLA